ncbi:MAG: hypothetical protein R3E90_10680 [Marinicella sp.]
MDLSLNNHIFLVGINTIMVAALLAWYAYGSAFTVTDVSKDRSLHHGKAVTGAGILMFVPFSLSIIAVFPDFIAAYLLLLMSLLGFFDDKFDLSFKLRLLLQALLVIACLYYYGYEPNLLMLFLLFASIWWINLFNFMDGANGMAGFHGLVVLLFYGVVFFLSQSFNFIISIAAAIILIYLVFNVGLKKLFMGDSGSLPLAFLLFVLALWSIQSGWLNYLQVAIIHAVFIADSTFTLLVRLKNGENITQAHASHLYQRLIKNGASHVFVSLSYATLTLFLCALALWVGSAKIITQFSTLLIIYGILLLIFIKTFKLGR